MDKIISKIGTKKAPLIISLKEFEGNRLLDIRKYFMNKDESELIPTKKGILLNSFQLNQLIDCLNSNGKDISTFFQKENINQISEINADIKDETLIGRSFKFNFENGITNISFDKNQLKATKTDDLQTIMKMLLVFNSILNDVFDEQKEVETILDRLDHQLKKVKW